MKLYGVAVSLPKALYSFIKNTIKNAALIGNYSKSTSRED